MGLFFEMKHTLEMEMGLVKLLALGAKQICQGYCGILVQHR